MGVDWRQGARYSKGDPPRRVASSPYPKIEGARQSQLLTYHQDPSSRPHGLTLRPSLAGSGD